MAKKLLSKILAAALTFTIIFSSFPVYAAVTGNVVINNGDASTTNQNVNLTLSAGNPTSLSKTETSQTDFSSGTLSKVIATSGDNVQLDKFIDGGFESGNLSTWDTSTGFQIVTNPVASGNYAAKGSGLNGGRNGLGKNFETPQKNLYFRCKMRFGEIGTHFPFYPQTNIGSFYAIYTQSDGHFYYFNGKNNNYFPIDTTYQANTWYNLEVYYYGGDIGIYKVLIDGIDITKGGLPAKDSGGNAFQSIKSVIMLSGDEYGNGTMIVDDVYITTNICPVFQDGFESGELSKWSSACNAIEFATDQVYSGKKSIKFTDVRTYSLYKSFNAIKNGYYRSNVMFKNSNQRQILFGTYGTNGNTWSSSLIAYTDGHFGNYSGYFSTDMTYSPDTWYNIEVYWSGDTSKYKVLINGTDLTQGGIAFKDDNSNLLKDSSTVAFLYMGENTVVDNVLVVDLDKTPTLTTTTPTYSFSGTRTSPSIDLSSVGTATGSSITWNASTPTGTAVNVDVSLDGGSTWQAAAKGGAILGITSGMSTSGKSLLVRQKLSTTNMETTPLLNDITLTINGVSSAGTDVQMMISNDSAFTGAVWETYNTSKSWKLTDGSGTKTVYAKFKDSTSESTAYNDTITYQLSVSNEELYAAIKKLSLSTVFRVIKDKDFIEFINDDLVDSATTVDEVVAIPMAVPNSTLKYTKLTGKFTTVDADNPSKPIVIGGKLILFKVIEPPATTNTVKVTFGQ